ncbi:hypothetical protein [Nocardioides sp. LS1]|uniref:hypothetical protein n=1 Tax=Nocardioides sp. LS1 TaxID=1027620 RepID=UPI000F6244E8|nr:hypothetical protein [Nocardioides sp. LS1]GCD88963.1 hypothetical protein NLS1_09690 [Nocardioides sp. LS1]
MRAITHGLGTALLLVATAFFTLVQIAHVDRAVQQISGRDGSADQVSLVSHTGKGHAPAHRQR